MRTCFVVQTHGMTKKKQKKNKKKLNNQKSKDQLIKLEKDRQKRNREKERQKKKNENRKTPKLTPNINKGRELTGFDINNENKIKKEGNNKTSKQQRDTIVAAAQAKLEKEKALSDQFETHVRNRSHFIKTKGQSLHINSNENNKALQTVRRISSLYQSDMQESERIRREAREIINRKQGMKLQDIQQISLRHVPGGGGGGGGGKSPVGGAGVAAERGARGMW